MKKLFLIAILLISLGATAQSKAETGVLAAAKAFHEAVFLNKDSAALDRLLASEVTYGHSGGKIEDRAGMIQGAIRNTSTYSGVTMSPVQVLLKGKTAVTRHGMTGTENKADGTKSELRLNILQTWIKDGRSWKLMARQAVRQAP
ncbi:nuclear transport factor 2 family protein [Flaviaesturariibacter amylovorans]|uniref:Nuclear transport factor 2 family protein n=1 Tax=Flaviaesturariibacter amylovorans TaxID=1084520 RepID=A0ABP8HA69_9BACT